MELRKIFELKEVLSFLNESLDYLEERLDKIIKESKKQIKDLSDIIVDLGEYMDYLIEKDAKEKENERFWNYSITKRQWIIDYW